MAITQWETSARSAWRGFSAALKTTGPAADPVTATDMAIHVILSLVKSATAAITQRATPLARVLRTGNTLIFIKEH